MRTKDRTSEIADGNPMAGDSNERRVPRPTSSRAVAERATMNPDFRHKSPNPKGGMVRKFLCIVAVSIVAALAFQSAASAQSTDCSGAAEQLQADRPNVPAGTIEMYLNFVPDVGGCLSFEGTTFIGGLSVPVYDPDTGEELGILKDLDPDLTSGSFSVTYEEFCGGFIPQSLTAQEYFEQTANAQEQAILDPDGDGAACTSDDDAFLSGDVGEPSVTDDPQCIDGIPDRDGDGQISSVEAAQAGADATQGIASCSGPDDEQYGNGEEIDEPPSDGETGGSGEGYETEIQFEQTWIGQITQTWDDDDTLETEVEANIMPISEMTENMIGEAVGEVRYVGYCTQTWILKEVNEDSVVVEGRLEDPNSSCVEFVPITLTPREDGSLEYYYSDTEYTGGSVGEGVLTLQGSGDYDETGFEETWFGFITEFDDEGDPVGGYELEIEIMPISEMTGDMIGEVVGRSTLSLGCTGIYILEEVNEDSVRVEGRVETGSDNCVDGIHVLTPQEDGALEHHTPGELNNYTSRGILVRQGSFAPYEIDLPFEQTWAGGMTQTMPDGATLDFELEADLIPIADLTEGMIGQIVGETSQEGVECNGVWILEELGEDSIVVEERITAGADYCVESTRITLTPQDDGSLEYYFLDSYGSVGEGILTLQGSDPPESEPEEIGVPESEPEDDNEPLPSEKMGTLGMNELPDTGGPALSPLIGGLLLGSGMLRVAAILTRRTRG